VINWNMFVQGSLERVLDSVLPHEINHTIFACHFRRPLPRWADEGAATLFEHESEQAKQLALLKQVMKRGKENFTLPELLTMKEYPQGMRQMLILYSQGFALAEFLVQQKGRKAYLSFLNDGEKMGWERAIRAHYAHDGIDALERNWTGWILAGMPKLTTHDGTALASTGAPQASARRDLQVAGSDRPAVIRSQSPDTAGAPLSGSLTGSFANAPQARPQRTAETADAPRAAPRPVRVAAVSPDTRPRQSEPNSGARFNPPRFQTLEAPQPQPRRGGNTAHTEALAATDWDIAGEKQVGNGLFEETVTQTLDAAFRRRTSDLVPSHLQHLQQTASSTDAADLPGPSDPFSFSPPRKRKVETGSTPQWAGFPGQTRSF
jgi:hypothetical protein